MRNSLSTEQLHERQHPALGGVAFRLRRYEVAFAADGRVEAVTLTLESPSGEPRVLMFERPEFDAFSPVRTPDVRETGPIYVIDRAADATDPNVGLRSARLQRASIPIFGRMPFVWLVETCQPANKQLQRTVMDKCQGRGSARRR
jgi:hypothetical protein